MLLLLWIIDFRKATFTLKIIISKFYFERHVTRLFHNVERVLFWQNSLSKYEAKRKLHAAGALVSQNRLLKHKFPVWEGPRREQRGDVHISAMRELEIENVNKPKTAVNCLVALRRWDASSWLTMAKFQKTLRLRHLCQHHCHQYTTQNKP